VYNPRLKADILTTLVQATVARSNLTDLAEGSAVLSVLGAFAEELEAIEFRLQQIRDSFTLSNSSGADLDERVTDLPVGAVARLGPGNASGSVLSITRSTPTVNPLVVPAGTVYSRSNAPQFKYVQLTDVTIAAGFATYPQPGDVSVTVTCSQSGSDGNCGSASIDTIKSGPSELITVVQTEPITSGVDRESDESLKQRAVAYLSGLARCNKSAIESMCKGFISNDGIQVRHASMFEDPTRPGISYVNIDDGTGFFGFTKGGITISGTVPAGSTAPIVIYHESPAVTAIASGELQIKKVGEPDFSPAPLNPDNSPRWVSVYERGIIYPDADLLDAGDIWKVENYQVYLGPIAELQSVIEGDPSNPVADSGYRAAGTRIIVTPAQIVYLGSMMINVSFATGTPFNATALLMKDEVVGFFDALAPGETFYKPVLYQRLLNVFDDIITLEITDPAANEVTVNFDQSLRIFVGNVEVV
jgi:hypothetical protein